jgi:hypothetical protein
MTACASFRTLIVRDALYRRTAHLLGVVIAVIGSGGKEMAEVVMFHHLLWALWT